MKKYAVLIGNSKFPDEEDKSKLPDLACPERDVDGLKNVLINSGRGDFSEENVFALKNNTNIDIIQTIETVFHKAKSDDLILIYYSGHGIIKGLLGKLYLASHNTINSEEKVVSTAVSLSSIRDIMDINTAHKRIILILDCCYSGDAAKTLITRGTADTDIELEKQLDENGQGIYLLTASGSTVAIEQEQHGLFTKYFIEGIETGDADINENGYIEITELFKYIAPRVTMENRMQVPKKYGIGETGKLIFSKSGRKPKNKKSEKIDDPSKENSHNILNEKLEVLKVIQKEARSRPVVPFLGAGISISAGFPTTKFIVQYLAKVNFAIKNGVFEDRFPKLEDDDIPKLEMYRRHPSKYLEDFGWPSLGQLNADIWDWLERPVEGEKLGQKKILEASRKELESISKNHFIDLLAHDIVSERIVGDTDPFPLEPRDYQQAIVQWVLRKEQAGYENGTSHAVLKEWIRWKEHYNRDNKGNEREPKPVLLHGDWEMLLDSLCEDKQNLTDALFTSFENGLNPTLSHRFLAFLQPKLGIDLLLTTNFDSLLERAFQQEGIPPKIFDIHKNAGLPNTDLICRQLSLLKLHGSTYGLRFGEQIKYSSETHSDSHALAHTPKGALIPKDALILVMGFNGSERSIMQMLHDFVQAKETEEVKPRLIWIQGPGEPSPLVDKLIDISNEKAQKKEKQELNPSKLPVQRINVKHVDTFIQELFFYITCNSYQASSMGYSSIPNRPLAKDLKRFPENTKDEKEKKRRPVQLCIAEIKKGNHSSSWSSLAGMSFVNSLDNDYTVIWIDFENHHTVEGIIAEIFKLVRILDPQAPFCAITDMDNEFNKVISKAVERIRDVFKRGRYVLVLDLVESFGRPQMVHHGIISSDDEHYIKRLAHLKYFLNELLDIDNTKKPYWDSYVVVTADMPRLRHQSNHLTRRNLLPDSYNKMFDLLSTISDKSKAHDHINIFSQTPNSKYSNIIENNEFIPETDLPKNLLEHWFQREKKLTNEEAKKRSLSRTEDAFLFLKILRDSESAKAKVKNLSIEKATNTFICVLSVFRRPRSLPLLRSFIERWGLRQIGTKTSGNKSTDSTWNSVSEKDSFNTHCAINELLQLIATNVSDKDGNQSPFGVISQNHEGGVVWLFREAYEATYDALTENIHRKSWATILEKDFNESRSLYSAAIMDGCLNAIWHLFAARSYYVDIFLATHDIKAFLEYLYHRVSAIRVITLLITIIEQAVKEIDDKGESVLWNDLNTHCRDLPNKYKNIHKQTIEDPFVWTILALGIFDPIKQDIEKNLDGLTDIDKLLSYFRILRQNSLSTLLMALNKNQLLLRIEAAPNTVLAWSNQFLYSELEYMEQIDGKFPIHADDPAVTTIKELRKRFIRLKHQSLRSKMDYKGALELSSNMNIASIKEIENQALNTIKKLTNLINQFNKIQSLDLDKNNDITKCEEFKSIETIFDIAFCLVEPGNENADKVTHIICEKLSEVKTKEPIIEKWLKKQLQTAYELHCRAKFKSTFWQPLLVRQVVTPNNKELEHAERYSVLYENLIRETTETNNDDAKRRSTILTIRARALYLRGYFAQAHHFLDLSTTGLFAEHIDHWALLGITNVVRAELLTVSANQHYFSLSKEYDQVLPILEMQNSNNKLEELPESCDTFINFSKTVQPIAASSLKKIKRAEHELAQAEKLFQNIAHQNIWLIHMEFGWAQIRIEKLLFEIELLFLSWSSLDVTDYIMKSGELEQEILDTMKRIRNVFDLIPYQSLKWSDIKKERKNEVEAGRSMTNLERNTLKLWRQLYVVGFYYSRLLGYLYKKNTSQTESKKIIDFEKEIIESFFRASPADEDSKYLEQWKLWCTSMRFDVFKCEMNMNSFTKGVQQENVNLKSISFRARVIEGMLNECSPTKIDNMWDIRRTET